MSAMRISEQLTILANALKAWCKDKGGEVSIVSNLRDLWQQASLTSQTPRILICYTGRRAHGPFATAAALGLSDRTFNVAFTRGRGYASKRGETLTETVGGADPFYDDLEDAEKVIRTITGISQDYPVDWKGDKAMQLGNLVVDGFIAEFSTANDEI